MLHRGREAGPQSGHLRCTGKDDLLKLRRRPQRPFVLPEEEEWQRLDVPRAPPPVQRRVRSSRNRRGQTACLEQRLRDAISNDELFVMTGVATSTQPFPAALRKKYRSFKVPRIGPSGPRRRSADRLWHRRPDRRQRRQP